MGGGKKASGKKSCKVCKGSGTMPCRVQTCVRGIDKKNGSVLERWTCNT